MTEKHRLIIKLSAAFVYLANTVSKVLRQKGLDTFKPCFFCLLLFAPLALNAEQIPAPNSQQTLPPITIQLKWKHQFQFAGYYAAVEQGYYQQAGYQVNLKAADPSINPIERVLSGEADYGIANAELVLYHLNGEPLTAIAAIIQHSPIVLMSLKKNNILSPQDLIGKRVMYSSGHYGANTLGILLKEGIKESQIESVPLSYNLDDLISGKVDAMVGYVTDQPFQLSQRGIEYNLIDPRAYGIDFYGDVLFTSSQRVEQNAKEVEAIRLATIKGWQYAIAHREELIDLIKHKYQSELSLEELNYEAEETIKLIVPKLVDLGHINPGRWQHIADSFISLGMTEGQLDTDSFIYSHDKNEASQVIRNIFQIIGIIILCSGLFISVLFYFNKNLKRAVNEKTMYLTKANRELIVYTKQLKDKEDELHTLNAELEKRIITRTETINQINYELTHEIKQRRDREVSLLLLSKAIESSSSVVLIINKDHLISYASSAFQKLTGSVQMNLEGQPISILEKKLSLPTIPSKALNAQNLSPNDEGLIESELKCIDANGDSHWMKTSISLLKSEEDPEQAEISHYVIIFEDITKIKNHRDEMERMALYDTLTGLENRLLFNKRLESVIENAKRNMVKTALLFIDIDNFKTVNDSLGHKAGDIILKTVAQRLGEHVRQNDSIARISGDEFTVLLTNIKNYEDASKVTQNIIDAFEQAPVIVDSQEVFVTLSIGISVTPEDSLDAATLIHNADIAMYQAKQGGRNGYQFYSDDMNNEIRHKMLIEKELKQAIDEENFFLEYQAIINAQNQKPSSVEALVRWQYSDDEVREANDFISIAESAGSIIPLGNWVLKQVISDIEDLLKTGIKHINIHINISHRQLKDRYFVSEVRALLSEHPNYAEYLCFEIKEQCFIGHQPENISRLKELKAMGITIAVDNFGTGYASINCLKQIQADMLKLDKRFLRGLPGEEYNADFTRAIISMAHLLKLSLVAQGVENEDQQGYLIEAGCDSLQGYLYGQPQVLDKLLSSLSS